MPSLAGTIPAPSSMASSLRLDAVSNQRALDQFLRDVERRALRMAELGCGSRDDALDMVQDAMCGFVRHYAEKPSAEWAPLFYRVLDSRLNDYRRRRTVRSRWLAVFDRAPDGEDADLDPVAQAPDLQEPGPLMRLAGGEAGQALESALKALPLRQRQAFLLRLWEGFDVATTAQVMHCSQGSVKTHLSRALAALRRALEDHQ